jgi:VWFA-related protein
MALSDHPRFGVYLRRAACDDKPAMPLSKPLLALGVAGLAIAFAQLPPDSAVDSAPKLVDLNVVALDNKDRPVEDLSADDFQVTDNGKPQPILFFRHNDKRLVAPPETGPRVFTNRPAGRPAHATAILLDLLNESFSAGGSAQEEVLKALSRVESGDELYLYILTRDGRLYPVRDIPAGEGDVPAGGPDWTAHARPIVEKAIKETFSLRSVNMTIIERVAMTYGGLEVLARKLGSVPGRKSLVWITHGLPISVRDAAGEHIDFQPYLRELSATFARFDAAIYPVMQVPPGMATAGSEEAQYSGMGSKETLSQFAELTGGRTKGNIDIGVVVRQAMADTRTSYQIGYRPPESNWDGKYHKIKITCVRKGVKTQSMTGYYAAEGQKPESQEAIDALVKGGGNSAEIGVTVRATPDAANPGRIHLEAHIDARDICLLRDGDRYVGGLRIAVAAYDQSGQGQTGKVVAIDLKLTAAERDEVMKKGIPYLREVMLGAPVKEVRLVVADAVLGAAGSVTMPAEKLRQ